MAAVSAFESTPAAHSAPIYYTRTVFDDVVSKTFGLQNGAGFIFSLDDELVDYIWHLTSGHSEAVHSIFSSLAEYFKYCDFRKRSLVVTLDDVLDFLANDVSLITSFKNNVHRATHNRHIVTANL
ncbi:hypothetical protein VTO42DRAFT_5559 [Malbranchea cinnamomea]